MGTEKKPDDQRESAATLCSAHPSAEEILKGWEEVCRKYEPTDMPPFFGTV